MCFATRGVLFAQDCFKRVFVERCLSICCYYSDHQIYHLRDLFVLLFDPSKKNKPKIRSMRGRGGSQILEHVAKKVVGT